MAEYVKVEQDGRVAIVTLDHPPVNALSSKLLEELEEEYDRLDRDDETRAIVLRGEGEKAFVAGADITEFPAMREQIEEAAESGSARGIQKLAARMDAGRTPVVAAIHGYCLGGGLELAMACDIRIAADDAQLGQPEIKLGLIPGGGGTQRLPRLVGHGRALLLNLSGDPISGSQAYDWGLVERAVPRAELMDAALDGDFEPVRLRLLAALAAEAVGVAQKALELGVDYVSEREQFGKKIGTYQAVSHPLADTYVETELARSLAYWAAWCVAEEDERTPVAVAAAKSYCAETAVAACERSIQVHGGIGFTWEHVLHRYYKRAQWIDAFGGHAAKQREVVAAALLD